ncbi:MAG: KTSC domain-containing protein [Hymenobacter sp.]|nr:MAG: KTSC domain-containing protein [Hymenobacter sp.]
MTRIPVTSSNLSSVGYDDNSQTLEIAFRSGGIYQYSYVTATVYQELMDASSHGKYFDRCIKKRGYPYRRVWNAG